MNLKGQTEITNEQPTCMLNHKVLVFYGTKNFKAGTKVIGRLYRATLRVADDLYVLSENQLVKQWDEDSIDNSPKLCLLQEIVYIQV